MKKILALTVALWMFSATFAFAGKVVTYNPGGHKWNPVRIVQTFYLGHNIVSIVTVTDPVTRCSTVTTTYYAFFVKVAESTVTQCP